jgi:hypothetical protein
VNGLSIGRSNCRQWFGDDFEDDERLSRSIHTEVHRISEEAAEQRRLMIVSVVFLTFL